MLPIEVLLDRRRQLAYRREIGSFLIRAVVLAAAIVILFTSIFGITTMKNNDMFPRIKAGDLLLYYRMENEFIAGDVVVFQKSGREYVGRIVAREGDTVEITNNAELIINGSIVLEDNIYYNTYAYDSDVSYPFELLENEYFVLCDYREDASDSRYFGAVSGKEIRGKIITVIQRSEI